MHAVAAATVAGGGGRARGRAAGADGTRRRRSARSRSASAAPARTSTTRSCAAERRDGGLRDQRAQELRDLRRARRRPARAGPGARAKGSTATRSSGDAAGVRFDGAWDGLGMAGNSSVAHGARRRRGRPTTTRIGAAGAAADLVFGVVAPTFLAGLAAVNVGIAQAAVTAAVAHAGVARVPGRDVARRAPDDPARARRHGPRDARGADAAARGGGARRRRRRGARSSRSWRRRWPPPTPARGSPSWRSRSAAARATRRRCRSSATCATPAPGAVMAPTNGVLRDVDRQGPRRAPGAMSGVELLVGAVSYHPRVVTIWERFRDVLRRRGRADRLRPVLELRAAGRRGARGRGRHRLEHEHRVRRARPPGRRRDADPRDARRRRGLGARCSSCARARRSASVDATRRPHARARQPRLRARGDPAAALPRRAGPRRRARCELLRFDTDLGKHGDTGDSELRVVRAVAAGEADAGALSDAYFSAFRAEGVPDVAELEVVWRSPTYYHCNFTVLADASTRSSASGGRRRCWRWTTTTRRCGRRWSSRASGAGCRATGRATRR